MKILILNGSEPKNTEIDSYLANLIQEITAKEAKVTEYKLCEMDINFCSGCWDCWWKTPGKCKFKDDMEKIYPDVLNTDLLLFSSHLKKGFESAKIKKVKDRLIPLLHCYIEIIEGECHHKKRYEQYPDLGFIFQKETYTDEEDLEILHDIQKRFALNFHAKVRFFETTNKKVEELAHEIITH